MRISFFNSSGEWLGDAHTSDGGGGGGLPEFFNWLWKTLAIAGLFSGFIVIPIYIGISMEGMKFTVLPDYVSPDCLQTFSSKALFSGVFVTSAFVMTIKIKKMLAFPIASCLLSMGYVFLKVPILHYLLVGIAWIFSAINIVFGSGAVFIIEKLLKQSVSALNMIAIGLIFGMVLGAIFKAIIYRTPAWWDIWE